MVEYIDPKLLKPDPHQPRNRFNEDDLKQLAQTFDAQDVINPIEVDENNFIILGERRWQAAKLKGLTKIPIRRKTDLTKKTRLERQLIDDAQRKSLVAQERVWAYATGVINANFNTDYIIEDIKQRYKKNYQDFDSLLFFEESGGRGKIAGMQKLADTIGVHKQTIWSYLSYFKVCSEIQQIFNENGYKGERTKRVTISHIAEIARLSDNPEAQRKLEQLFLEDLKKPDQERQFPTMYEIRVYVTEYQKKLKMEAEKRAGKVVKTKPPEKPKTPKGKPSKEEIEEATRRKLKELITKQLKVKEALDDLKNKIKDAEGIGLDVAQYKSKVDQLSTSIEDDPDGTKKEINRIKKELTDIVKLEKGHQKVENFLSGGKTNVTTILEEVKQLGLNVSDFEERINNIRQKSLEDPETAYNDAKTLKTELKDAVTTEKEHQKNVTEGQKIIDRIEKKLPTAKKYEKYGVNIQDYELKINELSNILQEDAKEVLQKLENLEKKFGEEIEKAEIQIKEAKIREDARKKAEEENRKKLEQAKKDAIEKAKQELMKDKELLKKIAKESGIGQTDKTKKSTMEANLGISYPISLECPVCGQEIKASCDGKGKHTF